jgi:hypothetical protein
LNIFSGAALLTCQQTSHRLIAFSHDKLSFATIDSRVTNETKRDARWSTSIVRIPPAFILVPDELLITASSQSVNTVSQRANKRWRNVRRETLLTDWLLAVIRSSSGTRINAGGIRTILVDHLASRFVSFVTRESIVAKESLSWENAISRWEVCWQVSSAAPLNIFKENKHVKINWQHSWILSYQPLLGLGEKFRFGWKF